MMQEWDAWADVHAHEGQTERQKKAAKDSFQCLFLDMSVPTFTLAGSRSGTYTTTLSDCTCGDFAIRRRPCKHMYRLAIEAGLLSVSAKPLVMIQPDTPEYLIDIEKMVPILDAMTDEENGFLYHFMVNALYHDAPAQGFRTDETPVSKFIENKIFILVDDPSAQLYAYTRNQLNEALSGLGVSGFKKNMSLDNLVNWCLSLPPDSLSPLCSGIVAVKLNPLIKKQDKLRALAKERCAFYQDKSSNIGFFIINNGNDALAGVKIEVAGVSQKVFLSKDEVQHLNTWCRKNGSTSEKTLYWLFSLVIQAFLDADIDFEQNLNLLGESIRDAITNL